MKPHPAQLISALQQWLRRWESQARVLVGSIRSVMDVQRAAEAGADIITIPPAMLPKMVDHKYSRETVGNSIRTQRAPSRPRAARAGQ